MTTKLAYTLDEAAAATSFSKDTIRRAIKTTKAGAFPPPLRAKRGGSEKKPSYRILHSDLLAWLESMGDA